MDSPFPRSEGSGCGETEEVGVNDDGTLNIQLEPIPPGCNWQTVIKDFDNKIVELPVTKGDVKLPIRVEYRCIGASAGEPPCKVKCYSCSEASCGSGSCSAPGDGGTGKEETANDSVYVRVPVGYRRFGDYKTYLRLHLPENSITNPGPSALKISSGLGYSHTMNDNGTPLDPSDDFVDTITCQFGYASIAKTGTDIDPKAFTLSLRTSSTAAIHRTIKYENTGSSFRVSSTFMGKTTVTDWHPKTGFTDTLTMDQGYLQDMSFEILRSVDKIVSQPDPSTYVIRHKTYERPSNAASGTNPSLLVSDREVTYKKYSWSWQVVKRVIDPDGAKLTTTYEYYQSGIMSGPSSYAGVGRLMSLKSHDGHEELHVYDDYSHTVFTPFKGDVDGVETTTTWNENFTERTHTKKVDGALVQQNIVTYNPGTLTYTSKDYSTANNFLTTTYQYYPVVANDANSAMLKKVINSDGTATLYNYTQIASSRTEEVKSGAYDITSQTITQGTHKSQIVGIHGNVITSMTLALGTGAGTVLDHTQVTSADGYGRAEVTQHFPVDNVPAYSTSATYECCGMATSTDKYGIFTHYMRDALGRIIKSNTLGVTQETLYNGLTVHSLRYAQSPPLSSSSSNNTNDEISRSFSNLSGTVQESWSRSPQSGDMVKMSTNTSVFRNPVAINGSPNPNNLPANVGQVTTQAVIQVTDDGATPSQQQTYYLDGNLWETSGSLSPSTRYTYQANADGMLTGQSYLDANVEKEASTTQHDLLGRSVTTSKGTFLNTNVYTGDKLTRSYDADGVDTFYFYNSEGELEKTVLDLDGNNLANDSIDQVTLTKSYPGSYTPPGGTATAVITTVQNVVVSGNTLIPAQTSHATPDGLKSWNVVPGVATPTFSTTILASNGLTGNGNWTETTTHPDGTKSHHIYTAGRLQKSQQLSNGSTPTIISETTFTTYDTIGRSTEVTDKRTGTSTTSHLNLYTDAVTSFSDAGNRTTSFTYDHRGRRTLVNQPDTGGHANETTTKYFPDGNTKEVTGGQTYRSTYTYDYAGRMKTLVTYGTATATTTWNYSATTGQLLSKRDDDNKGAEYDYTFAGRLKSRKWARGSFTRYDYDPAGRLSAKRYFLAAANSTGTNAGNDPNTGDVTFTYNRLSQNLRAVTAAGSARPGFEVSTAYSSTLLHSTENGLIIDPDLNSTSADGDTAPNLQRTIHRNYDNLGRSTGYELKTENSTLEASATYQYSGTNGRFAAVSSNPGGAGYSTTHDFIYGYQADSNLLKTTQSFTNYNFTTDTGSAIHLVTRTYEEDRDVLDAITNTKGSTTTVIAASDYTVNDIGQRTAITRSGSATSASAAYSYNNRGELVIANEATETLDRAYQYDGIGNREKTVNGLVNDLPGTNNWTANALNQYTKANGVTLPTTPTPAPYDFDGNLRFDGGVNKDSENREYVWDGENRLIEIKNGSGSIQKNYYDAGNRKIATTANSVTTYYIYDGFNRIAEYTGTTLEKSYLWGMDLSGTMQEAGGVGGLLAVSEHTVEETLPVVTTFYPTYDGNGNICEYLDGTGTSKAHYEYDAFGNVTFSSGDKAADFAYRFSTKPFDFITGWYYYLYRYYDPLTGRWPSRDPIGESGGLNIYGMCGNEAINLVDKLGLKWDTAKGLESLRKHLAYAGKSPPAADGPCCDTLRDGKNGWPSAARCAGFNCIEFLSSVISCGYRLNNDKDSSKRVLETAGDGQKLFAELQKLGWKIVFYSRDIYRVEYPYTNAGDDGEGHRHIPRADIADEVLQATRSRKWHGLGLSGAVTNFAPWRGSAYYDLPEKERDPGNVQSMAKASLNGERFVAISTTNAWHTALYAGGSYYDASPGRAAVNSSPRTLNNVLTDVLTNFGQSAAQAGVVAIPPDSSDGLRSYEADLNYVNRQRPGRKLPGYSPFEIDSTPLDDN